MNRKDQGSALILVLWSLVLISFLAGQYLDHNRTRASLAEYAWYSLETQTAIASALNLLATDAWPIPGADNENGTWADVSPNGIGLYVKVEDESNRININTAADDRIKERVLALMGNERWLEADQISDAILDWRDTDPMVRTHGAEDACYDSQGIKPANGPFKVFTELLLVRGVTPALFWGNPMGEITTEDADAPASGPSSLLDGFTIYPKNCRRIRMVIPGRKDGHCSVTAFLEKKNGRWRILHLYQSIGVTSGQETQGMGQTEAGIELS